MRDLLLTAIVFGSIPFIFYRPHIGVLVWVWLTFMTPFNYAWAFAVDFRFAFMIAAITVVAWIVSREPKRIVLNMPSAALLVFWLFTGLTTLFALFPDQAQAKWIELTKIVAIDLVVTVALFTDRRRINTLIWVIVGSIGFFGVKGGISTLVTGGTVHVGAVDGSYFSDNNLLAAALLMTIPLMRYLQTASTERLVRWGLAVAIAFCILGVLGTQSRGGFVGLIVVALMLFARSPKKLIFSFGLIVILAGGITFMPDSWVERMQTIGSQDVDASVQGRFDAWAFAYEFAQERPLMGGGFQAFRANLDEAGSLGYRSAHSIYFQVLGEHGFTGLLLYLLLIVSSLLFTVSAIRKMRGDPDLLWARNLMRMVQISMVVFLVTGVFLSMAYFELFVFLIAISIGVDQYVRAVISAGQPETRRDRTDRLAVAGTSTQPRIAE